jgi:hypothetical protein
MLADNRTAALTAQPRQERRNLEIFPWKSPSFPQLRSSTRLLLHIAHLPALPPSFSTCSCDEAVVLFHTCPLSVTVGARGACVCTALVVMGLRPARG